jgi:oligopeptide/dipeptide ABC transporter ATP-binding protein
MSSILSIRDLKLDLISTRGIVHAIRGISLDLQPGEIHGVVGESGSGKTMTAKSILRLHDETKTMYSGQILYNDTDILSLKKNKLRQLRGREISMVFQDPMVSLNPLLTIGEQISEMLILHLGLKNTEAYEKAVSLLENVGIHPAENRYKQYPFQFSGGMLQRIMIAIAISCNPKILIADEPTTALDVTIQAQTLELLKKLQGVTDMTILFVTHNFGVVAEICDRVSVMYAGKIVETGDVREIFRHPQHPYTKALLESIPKSGRYGNRLVTIPGSPPQLFNPIRGCSFAPRCPQASEKCFAEEPSTVFGEGGHMSACHLA